MTLDTFILTGCLTALFVITVLAWLLGRRDQDNQDDDME